MINRTTYGGMDLYHYANSHHQEELRRMVDICKNIATVSGTGPLSSIGLSELQQSINTYICENTIDCTQIFIFDLSAIEFYNAVIHLCDIDVAQLHHKYVISRTVDSSESKE